MEIRKIHPSATHHCYAYRFDPGDPVESSQDDGEPAGTAGLPILNTLRSYGLINVMCVIVRYYGGTKLGRSGLIDAYSIAAGDCIEQARLESVTPTIRFFISYPYDQQSLIDQLKHSFELFEIDADYTARVHLLVECKDTHVQAFEKRLQSIEHLLHQFEKKEKSYQTGF